MTLGWNPAMTRILTLRRFLALSLATSAVAGCSDSEPMAAPDPASNVSAALVPHEVDAALRGYLLNHGFTGRIASTLETRLGRRVDPQLANVGRLLWFDPDPRAERRQHVRRMSFADARFR